VKVKLTVKCPDDGACHHECPPLRCWRVRGCGPLSDVYPDNRWPDEVRAIHMTRAELDEEIADRYVELAKTDARVLQRFVDWLDEQGIALCNTTAVAESGDCYVYGRRRITESYESLFARFFAIDLEAVERHRVRLLAQASKGPTG